MTITSEMVKELREKTGAGIMACRKALEKANGDLKKAAEILQAEGIEKAEKKSDRTTGSGAVFTYIHGEGKIGAMIELQCETDFVARTEDFQKLGKEVAMQVSAMNPADVAELSSQPYIRDSKLSIQDLVKSTIAKIGENIVIKRFVRYQLGE
jgi:elongation factor Ts